MVDWLDWLIDELIAWLTDWLIDWLPDWLIDWLNEGMVEELTKAGTHNSLELQEQPKLINQEMKLTMYQVGRGQ